MDKIFEKANDQHVRNYIIYGNVADHKLYAESDHKTPIEPVSYTHLTLPTILLV